MSADLDRVRAALPGYEIGEEIGRGGFGVVLSGTHLKLQRRVAIKQVPPNFAEDETVRRRFADEARLMATIDHPHVVPVYDYVEQDDLCLLTMEYLPGGTVASRFSKTGFDVSSAIAVTLATAAGLHAAHSRGVLHRDIKPSNLMFAANGNIKLTDFGIAKILGGNETLITRAGEVVGTPTYLAPEQVRGEPLSPATDVYALSTMLYLLLSGTLPFPRDQDTMTLLFMHAFTEPKPLREVAPRIPGLIADVVMKGLATEPENRFSSAEQFAVALAECAASSWGTDWLTGSGIPVIGADAVVRAATGGSHQIIATQKIPKGQPQPKAAKTLVMPVEPLSQPNIRIADLNRSDVVPVQSVARFPSSRVPYAIAAALSVLAVAIALIGLGAPARGGDLRPGSVTIAGVDPTSGQDIRVDMSKPIPVTSTDGDAVSLAVAVVDQTISGERVPLIASTGTPAADVPLGLSPHLAAGHMTAELTVFKAGIPAATYRFGMQSVQSPFTTVLAGFVLMLALFAAAYVESYLRALRRGRNRFSAVIGLPLSAATLAVAVVGAAWVLLGHEPTVATLVSSAVIAAAAGVVATIGAMRVGRRYRHRFTSTSRSRTQRIQRDRFGMNSPTQQFATVRSSSNFF